MRVLVAIDEQASIKPVTEFVANHQWTDPTEVLVLHVIAPVMFDYPMASYPLFLETVQQESEVASRKLLEEARLKLSAVAHVKVESNSAVGMPVPVVIDAAKQWRADMIVVGCHGRQGFNKLIFGSVSQEIARQALCTVVVLRLSAVDEKVKESSSSRACAAPAT